MAPRRKTQKARKARKSARNCTRNCSRFVKRTRKLRRGSRSIKRSRKVVRKQRIMKGGNSATLRDPAKYNDLIDVIRDPNERDGFSAPVLVSRDTRDEMFDLDSESESVNVPQNNTYNAYNMYNSSMNMPGNNQMMV